MQASNDKINSYYTNVEKAINSHKVIKNMCNNYEFYYKGLVIYRFT